MPGAYVESIYDEISMQRKRDECKKRELDEFSVSSYTNIKQSEDDTRKMDDVGKEQLIMDLEETPSSSPSSWRSNWRSTASSATSRDVSPDAQKGAIHLITADDMEEHYARIKFEAREPDRAVAMDIYNMLYTLKRILEIDDDSEKLKELEHALEEIS
ncbi:hypothetical protein BP5796_05692 [Coleophoma crateriformis]|uniref:Uncharacterized protein n=1 Tax=Coleophoma crateriformis TaxID=565419 RepID=A0A3D8S4L0_9HELO|nr:hypothetical protein BP5796_05692 [Coleophoma crateriformis]